MQQWFILHTYSGHEKKVRDSLKARVRDTDIQDQVPEVLVPTETVVEMRGNKKDRIHANVLSRLCPGSD